MYEVARNEPLRCQGEYGGTMAHTSQPTSQPAGYEAMLPVATFQPAGYEAMLPARKRAVPFIKLMRRQHPGGFLDVVDSSTVVVHLVPTLPSFPLVFSLLSCLSMFHDIIQTVVVRVHPMGGGASYVQMRKQNRFDRRSYNY